MRAAVTPSRAMPHLCVRLARLGSLRAVALLALLLCSPTAPAQAEEEAAWVRGSKGLVALAIDDLQVHEKLPGTWYANVPGQGAVRSTNGGETWTRIMKAVRPLPGPREPVRLALDERNARVLYLVALGRIYRSEDGGDSWVPITSGLTSYSWSGKRSAELVYQVVVDPSKSVRLLCGTRSDGESHGGLFESNDSGGKWTQIAGTNVKGSELGADAWPVILSEKTEKVVLVGGRIGVWFSDDRGRKFKRTDPGGIGLHDIRGITPFVPGSKEVYLADARGVWSSLDNGETWSKKPVLEGDAVCVAYDPQTRKRLYAVLRDRGLFVSEDARRVKWTELGHADLEISGLAFLPRDAKAVVATSLATGLHLSRDEGATFSPLSGGLTPLTPAMDAVGVSPVGGAHLAVSDQGVVFTSADRGQVWGAVGRLGQTCRALRVDALGNWYACGRRLLKSADGGKTWQAVFTPQDPEDQVADAQSGPDGQLWIVLERALTVHASADGGKTWTAQSAFTGSGGAFATSLAVDARASGHLLVGARSVAPGLWSPKDGEGGPFESWDGGKTWAPLRDGLLNPKDLKAAVPSWNRAGAVAIDPVSGMLYYAAQSAGLFVRAAASWVDGKPPAEPWINLARWEVPSPIIAALCVAADGTDSRVLVQALGDSSTRALVEGRGAALLAAAALLKAGQELKDSPWQRRPDPRASLSGLVADPKTPGRFLAGDRGADGGIAVFEKPWTTPPAPPALPAPEPTPPVPVPPAPAPTAPPREVPTGLLAFSGSSDQSVGVWDLKSGASQSYLRGHTGEVRALALAPDESFAASGGGDKTIRLWNGSSGAAGPTFTVEGTVNALLFSADSKTLYAGLEETWAVLAIDLAAGLVKKLEGHTGGVVALALGADGTLWSAGRDRSVRSWDVEQGKPLALKIDLPAEPLAMALAGDGQRLFVTGKEAALRAYSPQDGKELGQAPLPHPLAAAVTVNPSSGLVFVSGEGQVLMFEGATLAAKGDLKAPSAKALLCLALSRDGAWIAAGDELNGLWLWDTATAEVRWSKAGAHTGQVNALVLTPDVAVPTPPPPPEGVAPGSAPGPAPAPDPGVPADPGAGSGPGTSGK